MHGVGHGQGTHDCGPDLAFLMLQMKEGLPKHQRVSSEPGIDFFDGAQDFVQISFLPGTFQQVFQGRLDRSV